MVENGQNDKGPQDVEYEVHPQDVDGDVHGIDAQLGRSQNEGDVQRLAFFKRQVVQVVTVKYRAISQCQAVLSYHIQLEKLGDVKYQREAYDGKHKSFGRINFPGT